MCRKATNIFCGLTRPELQPIYHTQDEYIYNHYTTNAVVYISYTYL